MKAIDLIKIYEDSNDEVPKLPSRTEIEAKKREHQKMMARRKEWDEREKNKGKTRRGQHYATIYHELEREMLDADGDPIYIEVECTISGTYVKGYPQTYYEPGEPSGFEDVYLEWAEPIDPEPEGGPLTMKEKLALDQWFDEPKTQDYAQQALLDTYDD